MPGQMLGTRTRTRLIFLTAVLCLALAVLAFALTADSAGPDASRACVWYSLAVESGDEEAAEALEALTATMPPKQIAEAENMLEPLKERQEP